jgi:hypothetical protein
MFWEFFEGIGKAHSFSYKKIPQFEDQEAEEKVGLLYLVSRRRVKVLGSHKRGYSQPIVERSSRKTYSILRSSMAMGRIYLNPLPSEGWPRCLTTAPKGITATQLWLTC